VPLREGGYALKLPKDERKLLASLPGQLRALLDEGDESLVRLFPPAADNDPEANADFAGLMAGELRDGHPAALAVLEDTAAASTIDEGQLDAWLRALNSLRLVLGTQLGVTEDTDHDVRPYDPLAPQWALYHYLSVLQEQAVDAARQSLP
jgi:hypothetical protein